MNNYAICILATKHGKQLIVLDVDVVSFTVKTMERLWSSHYGNFYGHLNMLIQRKLQVRIVIFNLSMFPKNLRNKYHDFSMIINIIF